MRPETPEQIRARLARLDAFFRDAGAEPATDVVSPDDMKRVMDRIHAAYADRDNVPPLLADTVPTASPTPAVARARRVAKP